jgi:hypothetical protein
MRKREPFNSHSYILNSSGPLTLRKFNEHSVATAFARRVFPVPGGPYLKRQEN